MCNTENMSEEAANKRLELIDERLANMHGTSYEKWLDGRPLFEEKKCKYGMPIDGWGRFIASGEY